VTAKDAFPYCGGRLCVVAPGQLPPTDRVPVVVAAGAFGSGEHETTASCLQVLEGLEDLGDAHVLDLGSGTGILAIAAVKLGAASATCVDTDPAAVTVARYNADLNGVASRVAHVEGELGSLDRGGFDLAVANLYADVLLAVAADLVARVRPGGTLVLSGIAWEHDWDVRQRYLQLGCGLLRHRMLAEYSTVVLRRPVEAGQ
jgi:ribosomal protein L11 methyltransferase